MQKLAFRSSYAKKYAARKLAKQKVLDDRMHMVKDRLEQKETRTKIRAATKQYQQQRWESVYRGPLAPRYDVGAESEKYGTVTTERSRIERVSERKRVKCPFAVDDRVVLVGAKYRDRGRIGKVVNVDDETQSVKIEGVEMANFFQEPYMRAMVQSSVAFSTAPLPVPFADVRLVYPLVHPETGVLRDVIINEVELREPSWQEKRAGIEKPIRSIAGLVPVVELPYPEEKEPDHTTNNADTQRIEVEERTWVPTLTVPPMPPNIIDELRNKYSVFRTRYDDAFIAKKEAAAQRKADKQRALKTAAKTPLDEINLANRDKLREFNNEASKDGAWAPLSSQIIESMARLALETEAKTGRKLSAETKSQFELIQKGFEDDPAEVSIVEDQLEEEPLELADEAEEKTPDRANT